MLRLAQPASPSKSLRGGDMKTWLARTAGAGFPPEAEAMNQGAGEFIPSQWLVGH